MTPTERSYRRYVRLLPAGFRQRWEEDMVNAYLERAEAGHSTVGERLSLVALAVRTWLSGAGASPRRREWYRAAQTLALLVLLHQAVFATQIVASTVDFWVNAELRPDPYQLWLVADPLWIAAFFCLVLGRGGSARVLTVVAAGVTIAADVVEKLTLDWDGRALLYFADDPRPWLWAALATLVVFIGPARSRPSRWGWLGAYAVAAALLVLRAQVFRPVGLVSAVLDGNAVAKILLAVGMLALLVATVVGRARASLPSRWFFALAALAVVVGLNGLFTNRVPFRIVASVMSTDLGEGFVYVLDVEPRTLDYWVFSGVDALNPVLFTLAGLCAIAGLILLRRLPGRLADTVE